MLHLKILFDYNFSLFSSPVWLMIVLILMMFGENKLITPGSKRVYKVVETAIDTSH